MVIRNGTTESEVSKILITFVNGKKVEDPSIDPEWSLLYYLRTRLRLTGTKLACGEGGCGACTVMISKYNRHLRSTRHYTVNACLTPLASVHGMAVTTVEGIGSLTKGLHVVQERIAKAHGSQCGFCTPGMVMSMYTLLRNNPIPSMEQLNEHLAGNLCRCTGYRPILDGFGSLTREKQPSCGMVNCCRLSNDYKDCQVLTVNGKSAATESGVTENRSNAKDDLFDTNTLTPYDPSQEIIFPPELKVSNKLDCHTLQFIGPRVTYWRPVTLHRLLFLKHQFPQAKIIAGNTEVGVEANLNNQVYPVLINASHVSEMTCIKLLDSGLEVGAALCLTDLQDKLKELISTHPEYKTQSMKAMLEMLKWFAGKQIRNVASLGGNIMNCSPISDLNPVLMAAGATLTFAGLGGNRKVRIDKDFFVGYRKTSAFQWEVLLNIHIPFTHKEQFIQSFKQSRRRDDDISIINAAMNVEFQPGTCNISQLTLAYGGMAATTITAPNTMKILKGQCWDKSLLEKGTLLLARELTLPPSAPGGMVQYRQTLAVSFFFKFYLSVQRWLSISIPGFILTLQEDEESAIERLHIPIASSTHLFKYTGERENGPVGRPLIHSSAYKHTTGEAVYVDDLPSDTNDLHAAFVISSRAHAAITNIDSTDAMDMEGVEAFFCAKDLPGEMNVTGPITEDEEVFRRKTVQCVGQVIGLVVANDQKTARLAAKCVKIEYEDLPLPIMSIEEAIREKSFWGSWTIQKGKLDNGFAQAAHILEGEMCMGGQNHFYLEPNAHIAVPKGEDEEIELFTTTQNPAGTQLQVCKALGVQANKVLVRVKRIGGGFGGKETRSCTFSIPVAIAASKLKRVVRTTLDRHEDMVITGGRHPFLCRWKAGVMPDGHLTALKINLYANAGCSRDLSFPLVQKCLFSIDSAYKHNHIEATGYACRTNFPSTTAFRGFGVPQAAMFMEDVMSRVAAHLGVDPQQVRERNLYQAGDLTHINFKLENCNIRRCWNQVLKQAQVETRSEAIRQFNRRNRYRKRGLAQVPVNFGIGYEKHLNQGGSLVHAYRDGSVLLTHGGVEMGQGLHTKMIQVASQVLGIPVESIHISDTATDKVPNASPTAASISSDIYGMAVVNACQELMDRLHPYMKIEPKATWKDWVNAAYMDHVSLSCTGFYKISCITNFDFETQKGRPFNYLSQGAAVSEVEIDCLTGDHTIRRTDIVMDVGNSLNPAIDIGQIEGGFMQGVGLVTLEELLYSPLGELVTKGPGAYKIPGFQDIPSELHVSLLQDAPNPKAVFSSKAIGEPPLVLATSVFQALKSAIGAARENEGVLSPVFRLDSPATSERIRMACHDFLVQKILEN